MANLPNISDAEWEVMAVLWGQSPLSAGQIVEKLEGKRAWKPRTVKSLLSRLVKKGAVDYVEQGKSYLYTPNITRQACVRSESRSFASRVFAGAAGPMLVQFVKQSNLSASEIEELKKVLEEKSGGSRK